MFGRPITVRWSAALLVGWAVAVGVLSAVVPSIESVIETSTVEALPAGAPSSAALREMDEAFGSGRAESFVTIVLANPAAISRDDPVYADLVDALARYPDRFVEVQDYLSRPAIRASLTSSDGQATYIPVALASPPASPGASADYHLLLRLADEAEGAGQTDDTADGTAAPNSARTTVGVTGAPAIASDLFSASQAAAKKVTLISFGLIAVLLLLIFRRLSTIVVPLVSIGLAVGGTHVALSLLAGRLLSVSTYTPSFADAIVLGAVTDYTVFLISRFREEYRDVIDTGRTTGGVPGGMPDRSAGEVGFALARARSRINKPITASAATVVLATAALHFAKSPLFVSTGPPMAVGIAVSWLVAMTATPALIRLLGRRIGPAAPVNPRSRWRRVGRLVAGRPARVLAAGTGVLVVMAAFLPTASLAFNDGASLPDQTPSAAASRTLAEHFPANEATPEFLLLEADHTLRSADDLAALNSMSRAIAAVPGVQEVRSITQPSGRPLKRLQISNQLGTVADGLDQARGGLGQSSAGVGKISDGANRLAEGITTLADKTHQSAAGARDLAGGTERLGRGTQRLTAGLSRAADGSRRIAGGLDQLAAGQGQLTRGLERLHGGADQIASGLDQILDALDADPLCTADPICRRSRAGLARLAAGQHTLGHSIGTSATGSHHLAEATTRLNAASAHLADGLDRSAEGLGQIRSGQHHLAQGQQRLAAGLDRLAAGTTKIATATGQLPDGLTRVIDANTDLSNGLESAQDYLDQVNQHATTPQAGGFYLPPSTLRGKEYALAASQLLSPDGRLTRLQIVLDHPADSTQGLQTIQAVRAAARRDLDEGPLTGSTLSAVGLGAFATDTRTYFDHDLGYVVAVVLLMVFLVLVLTLRSLTAPLYLLASVALSVLAALGLTVAVYGHLLGQQLAFSVPVIAFVLLVAVGADYNILLMSRLREEHPTTDTAAVADTVAATGPVITSAGIIFAGAFIALATSDIPAIAQSSFALTAGLLLDTFIVRTLVVPPLAVLLGNRNWWPQRRSRRARSQLT